ncbi:hypothetical protein [Janthinobacterium sp.]|nr:hypothetical protein [Janthinobacterium sp.]
MYQDIGDEHKRIFIFFANSFAIGMPRAGHAVAMQRIATALARTQ